MKLQSALKQYRIWVGISMVVSIAYFTVAYTQQEMKDMLFAGAFFLLFLYTIYKVKGYTQTSIPFFGETLGEETKKELNKRVMIDVILLVVVIALAQYTFDQTLALDLSTPLMQLHYGLMLVSLIMYYFFSILFISHSMMLQTQNTHVKHVA